MAAAADVILGQHPELGYRKFRGQIERGRGLVNKAKEPFIGFVQANSSPPQVAPSYACLFSSVIHPLVHALSHQPSSSFLTSLHILLNFHTDLKKDIKPPSKYNPIPAASHPSNCIIKAVSRTT